MSPPAIRFTRRTAIAWLVLVTLAWGSMWPIGKLMLPSIPPIWLAVFRLGVATVAIGLLCAASGRLRRPSGHDLPVILSVGILHMTAFSVLGNLGLQRVSAGTSIVLAYTTPLWVLPAAWLFLGERLTPRQWAGFVMGCLGAAWLTLPGLQGTTNQASLLGHLLILAAAFCWSISILIARHHVWRASPLELLPWQMLLSLILLLPLALSVEGVPSITWTRPLVAMVAYSGLIGTALAYWAMNSINRVLPASVTSMALLGTPICGMLISALLLGEQPNSRLIVSAAAIFAGILLGLSRLKPQARHS